MQAHLIAAAMALVFAACTTPPTPQAAAAEREKQATEAARKRIAEFEAAGGTDPKGSVSRIMKVSYEGKPAYLFIAPCCDRFNDLHDADGRRLCAPSGGFSGQGDGKCSGAVRYGSAASQPKLPSNEGK